MPKWSVRRRPSLLLGAVLLIVCLPVLRSYVPWNLHEPERGTFDFSGNLDLEAFILLAAEVGLWVILRPGPYICSEVDLGGLPSWLLRDPDMRLRTTYKGFTEAVDLYFDHLMLRVVPLQYKHGGPIIAVQVENEYGSYNKDPAYMPYIKKALQDRGIAELLLTSDNQGGLKSGVLDGVLATINNQNLGRYWNIGPQETLYLPGAWLDVGLNKIIVFEEKMAQRIIQFVDTPNLGQHEYVH